MCVLSAPYPFPFLVVELPLPHTIAKWFGTYLPDFRQAAIDPNFRSTANLCTRQHSWRIVAVGDGYQFSAVGRGGIFDHLTTTLPDHRISRLEQVHRFDAPWEATASAKLRQGDATILDLYEQHDRIIPTGDQTLAEVVTEMYVERKNAGVEVGVFAATNQQVAELNASIQGALSDTGQLKEPITGTGLFIGDVIETRSNNRELTTDTGQFVKNRDRWTITAVDHGGLVVTGTAGTVTLPVVYVAEHVNLAYAQTAHASQGRTISGTSIYAYDPDTAPADRAGIYVPLTRGKHENLAVVQADNVPIAKQHLADAVSRRWIDTPAITHLHEPQPAEPVGLATQIDTAKDLLDNFEQQSLFDTGIPSPTINPTPPEPDETRRATRSEAQERQHQPVEPVVVLLPGVLIDKLAVVERLGWSVDNAHTKIAEIKATHATVTANYRDAINAHKQLTTTYNDHLDKMPLVRGRKKWEATLTSYDHQLKGSHQNLDQLKETLGSLKNQHNYWSQYRSLTPQVELGNARTALTADRHARGHQAVTDPEITSRLGLAPQDPAAFTVWKEAAGAISQHSVFNQHRHNPDLDLGASHYTINSQLKTDIRTATQTLGEHVGYAQVPDLQPKTISRTIEGPSLGL